MSNSTEGGCCLRRETGAMNKARSGGLANPIKILRLQVELGDTLLFLYVLAFVRQYFWVIDNNLLAWTLSVPLASVFWYFYISTKQFPAEKFGRSFWLLVGLPLLAAYMLRAAFPDHSFDVLTYHLLHS